VLLRVGGEEALQTLQRELVNVAVVDSVEKVRTKFVPENRGLDEDRALVVQYVLEFVGLVCHDERALLRQGCIGGVDDLGVCLGRCLFLEVFLDGPPEHVVERLVEHFVGRCPFAETEDGARANFGDRLHRDRDEARGSRLRGRVPHPVADPHHHSWVEHRCFRRNLLLQAAIELGRWLGPDRGFLSD